MLKIENLEVFNLEGALRGMRFPMQSNDKSDTPIHLFPDEPFIIGEKDLALARKLINAGSDHSKFMRQILVSMDITAPLYWLKEFDTYKVATVANSESTMHKLATTPITRECFSFDGGLDELMDKDSAEQYYVDEYGSYMFFSHIMIEMCEQLRKKFVETGEKRYWRALIQLLPTSWNQKRHWTASYATLANIAKARANHKLEEWSAFIRYINEHAPYFKELTNE